MSLQVSIFLAVVRSVQISEKKTLKITKKPYKFYSKYSYSDQLVLVNTQKKVHIVFATQSGCYRSLPQTDHKLRILGVPVFQSDVILYTLNYY